MKRMLVILLLLSLCLAPVAVAETNQETVAEMTYIVKMPDVIREGKYTGQVVNGVPHGYGVFVTANSSGVYWHYLGEWVDGKMTGQGGQYWDIGQCHTGTFENGAMQCGHVWQSDGVHFWYDRTPNEHGCYSLVEYRSDGSKYMECCVNPETTAYHIGTIYTKSGEVFFSGTIGEGFDWNLLYIE